MYVFLYECDNTFIHSLLSYYRLLLKGYNNSTPPQFEFEFAVAVIDLPVDNVQEGMRVLAQAMHASKAMDRSRSHIILLMLHAATIYLI